MTPSADPAAPQAGDDRARELCRIRVRRHYWRNRARILLKKATWWEENHDAIKLRRCHR